MFNFSHLVFDCVGICRCIVFGSLCRGLPPALRPWTGAACRPSANTRPCRSQSRTCGKCYPRIIFNRLTLENTGLVKEDIVVDIIQTGYLFESS